MNESGEICSCGIGSTMNCIEGSSVPTSVLITDDPIKNPPQCHEGYKVRPHLVYVPGRGWTDRVPLLLGTLGSPLWTSASGRFLEALLDRFLERVGRYSP